MNYVEVYIQEVTRRLPEKSREDIAMELRSTIEDSLPDNYSEVDVKRVLGNLGSPAALASGYRDRPMYLIGPRYYDVYVTLLKMILPIAFVISFISVIAQYIIGLQGNETILNEVIDLVGVGIARVLDVGMQTFFWLTIVFAVMERTDKGKDGKPMSTSLKKWTPDDLKSVPLIPVKKAITGWEVFWTFFWIASWATFYFYADHLIGIYRGGSGELDFVTPAFQQDVLLSYWPLIVLMIGLEVAFALYKLIQGRWTGNMAKFNIVIQVIATIVLIVILTNPNIFNENFLSFMADAFSVTPAQFGTGLTSGAILIFISGAAYNIYDGFRKNKAL